MYFFKKYIFFPSLFLMDSEIDMLLEEHKKLEEKTKAIENKSLNLFAHKRTLVKALAGNGMHYFLVPTVNKTYSLYKNVDLKKTHLIILNIPSKFDMETLVSNTFSLANYIDYKGMRLFFKTRDSISTHPYEIYITSVLKTENSHVLEIVDSQNNIWNNFNQFAACFDNFPFTLNEWLGL